MSAAIVIVFHGQDVKQDGHYVTLKCTTSQTKSCSMRPKSLRLFCGCDGETRSSTQYNISGRTGVGTCCVPRNNGELTLGLFISVVDLS